jgi:Flp pilus assembly protein TadB
MNRWSSLRASDQDREHVAERLRRAAAEGRLFAEELEERLARALRARTLGELEMLTADLPGTVARRPGLSPVAKVGIAAVVAVLAVTVVALAVLAVTGLLSVWIVWVVFAWVMFGRRRHRHYGRRGPGGPVHVHYVHRRML